MSAIATLPVRQKKAKKTLRRVSALPPKVVGKPSTEALFEEWLQQFGPLPKELWPKVDHLITEDDTPVENFYSEKQGKFGTSALYDAGEPFGAGRKFIAVSDVALYNSPDEPPQVPDIMVSLDVELAEDIWEKGHRSYMIWLFGKPPEVVIEIVSNKVGNEDTVRKQRYEQMRVAYYVIYDPGQHLSKVLLRVYELRATEYVLRRDHWLPGIGLGLTLWRGVYEDREDQWLRWQNKDGNLLLTGSERAEQESQRAEQEHQRAELLAAKLREMGIDPTTLY